jgi:uncharacterized protein
MFRPSVIFLILIFSWAIIPPVVAGDAKNKNLSDSIAKLHLQGVKNAIQQGADPNTPEGKVSPLKYTAILGWAANTEAKKRALAEILRFLFENGAKLTKSSSDYEILIVPIRTGNVQAVRVLLENGASPIRPINGQSPMTIAEEGNQAEVIELLVEYGALRLAKGEAAQAKLITAVIGFEINDVKKALAAGAKVNTPAPGNRYALITALTNPIFYSDRVKIIELLLSKDADPNVIGFVSKYHTGTPLTTLAAHSYLGKDKDKKPIRQGILQILDMLVERGADIRSKDSFGQTSLHIAAEQDVEFLVEKLIELGADITALDNQGYPPLKYAKSKAVAALLKLDRSQAKLRLNKKDLEAGFKAHRAKNDAEAIRLLRPFARNGDQLAQMVIGSIYDIGGNGIQQNYRSAAIWYRKAAEQGEDLSQYRLGKLYAKGLGVKHDKVKAVKWFRRSADQGNGSAQVELAIMYQDGVGGLQRDNAKAKNLFLLAAEQGNIKGELMLGLALDEDKDYAKSVKWYRKAADQGNPLAQLLLGHAYRLGQGVEKSSSEAGKLYRLAANQGNAVSQGYLAAAYLGGRGVPKDIVTAYMWFNLSAAQGDKKAEKARNAVGKLLSKGQLSEAQRLSRNWKPKASTVKKRAETSKGPVSAEKKSSGTGFYISGNGHILTNFHVIKGCKKLSIHSPFGSSGTATVIAKNKRDDLALLKTTRKNSSIATFRAGASPRIGEQVIVYGFPLAGLLSSSGNLVIGNLSALSGIRNDPRHYQITAPVQPGNSGGPLLDESGRIIGVVVSKLNAALVAKAIGDIPQNVNFAIKSSTVLGFVEASGLLPKFMIKSVKKVPATIAEEAQSFTVQVVCRK